MKSRAPEGTRGARRMYPKTIPLPLDLETRVRASPAGGARATVLLGVAAFVLAGTGQYFLFAETSRPLGVALLGLSMLFAVAAWRGRRETELLGRVVARRALPSSGSPLFMARLAGVTVSVGLAIASIRANMAAGSVLFGLQGWLWLASMALLIVSCAFWDPRGEATTRLDWERKDVVLSAGLLLLSFVTHLAFLNTIPWRYHFDEGFASIETMRFYKGPAIPLFGTTWKNTSLPTLWFAIAALFMRLTGPTLAGVRLGVAVVGALTVLPVYGIGRLLWGRLAGALAGFAVAVSAAYVHYSRVSILNVTTPFAWAVCFYFLLKGLGSRRPGDFVRAGLAAGLSMYTYYGTRLLPYLLVAFLVYLGAFHFRAFRERLGHFALMAAGALAGFGPLLGYFLLHPQMWYSRAFSRLTVSSFPTTLEAMTRDWKILAPLAARNFLGIGVLPSRDTVWYNPLLLAPEAALVVLGGGLLLWRWRQPGSFLVLLWALSVILTGPTLLDAATIPNLNQWSPAFPTFYLAMALPVALFIGTLLAVRHTPARVAGALLLGALLAADLAANGYSYLVRYPARVPADHSLEALQGRYAASVAPGTHVLIVGKSWVPVYAEMDRLVAPRTTVTGLLEPDRELPLSGETGRNLAFLFYNDMFPYVPKVRRIYPGGTLAALRTPDGTLVAYSYFVPAARD